MRGFGRVLGLLGTGVLAGGMLFFGAVMAPLVFTKLPPEVAGPFIRAAFPWYYGFTIITACIGAAGFLLRRAILSALVLFAIVAATVWLWAVFMPMLDAWRVAGNVSAFTRGHHISVWINGAELLAAIMVFIRAA